MKKRFAAVFAATAVLGVTTAFAANPFSDVTPNDWAYQSVAQLAAAGVINGYPDGTFKGQNNITRYEMAQMVAKAMANESRANAEQQAMINRLANEFSDELNNLGVRVSNLENKVGNVKVTGDARLRYQGSDKKGMISSDNQDKKSLFDMRGRVQFNANVNDNTSAVIRVTSGDMEFGDAKNSSDVEFDRVYVAHKFGKDTTAVAGRFGAVVGNGLVYDDTFDGAGITYDNGNFSATAAYGSFMEGGLFDNAENGREYATGYDFANESSDTNPTVTLLQAKAKLGEHATLGGFYTFGNKNLDNDIYGGSLDLNFDKVWVGGEYATFSDEKGAVASNDKDAWVAGIGYGDYDIEKQGTWGVKVQYFDEGKYSPVVSSTWNQPYNSDYKAWMASVDYALADNVGLSGYWAFNAEDQQGNDLGDYYRAELKYKF
ncbi:S-layer homology domain-containing protein [Veillonella intestinalis]|uniref:S-layer homology domain-containing protein n=1 Tax=Veillonella intestinalis TaxID=2941341 RepID=UPI00203CB5BA|nr:S-layer homology domain-containing protein [Veillonella intestinalis]